MRSKTPITIEQIMIAIYDNSESDLLELLIRQYGQQSYDDGVKDQKESSQSYFN